MAEDPEQASIAVSMKLSSIARRTERVEDGGDKKGGSVELS
jgi:hypothetical protein